MATAFIPTSSATIQEPFGNGGFGGALVTLDVSAGNLVLPAGATYFVGVSPVMNFAGNGQLFLYQSSFASPGGGSNAFFINPGVGFGLGTSQAQAYNAAYAVETVPVPEPAAGLAAVGLAMVCARLIRRSRSA